MPGEEAVVYTPPAGVNLRHAAAMEDALRKVPDQGEFVVDMNNGQQENYDSAMICLLIDLLRVSTTRDCAMRIINVSPQLQKLIALYQLQDILPVAGDAA